MTDERFKEILNELKGLREEAWTDCLLPANEPGLMYHYTRFEGFAGILQTKTLRASHISSLNDSSEFYYGAGVVHEAIGDWENDELGLSTAWAHPKPRFDRVVKMFYVASFSESGDKLSQWRAYGDGGKGFAIGFDRRTMLRYSATKDNHGLLKMCYDRALAERVHKLYGDMTVLFRQVPTSDSEKRKCFIEKAIFSILHSIVFMKHGSFDEEKEMRRLSVDPPLHEITVTTDNERPRTFWDVPFPWGGISEVVVGPLVSDAAFLAARTLLDQQGYTKVQLRRSEIPLRG
jgi:hypothetical protein